MRGQFVRMLADAGLVPREAAAGSRGGSSAEGWDEADAPWNRHAGSAAVVSVKLELSYEDTYPQPVQTCRTRGRCRAESGSRKQQRRWLDDVGVLWDRHAIAAVVLNAVCKVSQHNWNCPTQLFVVHNQCCSSVAIT